MSGFKAHSGYNKQTRPIFLEVSVILRENEIKFCSLHKSSAYFISYSYKSALKVQYFKYQ